MTAAVAEPRGRPPAPRPPRRPDPIADEAALIRRKLGRWHLDGPLATEADASRPDDDET